MDHFEPVADGNFAALPQDNAWMLAVPQCAAVCASSLVRAARSSRRCARGSWRRRRSGDAERARELLGKALATARRLGLTNVERRASALLQATTV